MQDEKFSSLHLFDGTNYNNWKFKLMALLDEHEMKKFIETDLQTTLDGLSNPNQRPPAEKLEKKCISFIVHRIADSHLEYVKGKETAYEILQALDAIFQRKSITGQLFARRKMLMLKYSETDLMHTHLVKFDKLTSELKSSGAEINEIDLVCNLLLTLPTSFEPLITAIETMDEKNLTLDYVKGRLLDESAKRENKNVENKSDNNVAMSSSKLICHRCGIPGHIRKDCRVNLNKKKKFHKFDRNDKGDNNNKFRNKSANANKDASVAFIAQNDAFNSVQMMNSVRFCLDSGASDHMVNDKSIFIESRKLSVPQEIKVAKSGVKIFATEIGKIKGFIEVNGKIKSCEINDVLFVKELTCNLFSIKCLEEKGFKIVFEKGLVNIFKNNELVGQGKRNAKLFELTVKLDNNNIGNLCESENNLNILHRRLGHLNMNDTIKLVKNHMVDGIKNVNTSQSDADFCESCKLGKQTRLPFKNSTSGRSKRPLELIHSDVVGPITPDSYNDCRYIVTFIDDYTHFAMIYVIKSKSEVYDKFREYYNLSTVHFERKISRLRCDNGGEYISDKIRQFCREKGIKLEYTNPYTPQQNGVAERFNRNLMDRARTMVIDANLDKMFWSEAVLAATYVINRSPTSVFKDQRENKTPAEIWFGKKPNLANLKIFGCTAYVHMPSEKRTKLDAKSYKCIMMGYTPNGYRLWDPLKNKIIFSRDVVFNEINLKQQACLKPSIDVTDLELSNSGGVMDQFSVDVPSNNNSSPIINVSSDSDSTASDSTVIEQHLQHSTPVSRTRRVVRRPDRYGTNIYDIMSESAIDSLYALNAEGFVESVPLTVEEAKESDDWHNWKGAMQEEFSSLIANNTWSLIELPRNKNLVDCKWIFKIKRNDHGNIVRYKARLVARGFTQVKGFDYGETYAPVTRLSTFRVLLVIANQFGLHVHQMDVTCAFLQGDLKEEIYMKQPIGFEHSNKNLVCKLNKAIYGLKQSSKCWNVRFHNFVVNKLGFRRSLSDYCLYIKVVNKIKCFILIYVDDIILASNDLVDMQHIKNCLMSEFKMKDLKNINFFLGMKINYDVDKGIVELSQQQYLQSVLKRFRMEDCKDIATPMEYGLKLESNEDLQLTDKPYRELIGCLMYGMLATRPDLCASISYFSRFQTNAQDDHWNYLKRVLRYVKGTLNAKMVYKREPNDLNLIGYADADWANDINDRKSISGYVFKLFGSTVSWASRKQLCVTVSSTEAEYIALCEASKEALWLKGLVNDFNIFQINYVSIFEDNQGCMRIAEDPKEHKLMKHVDTKYHFVRELVQNEVIDLHYIRTDDQIADVMTKPLQKRQFIKLRKGLNIVVEAVC